MEATKQILQHHQKLNDKPPAILAITANAQQEVHDQCLAMGMAGFVSKPVTMKTLELAIRKLFHDRN